MPYKLLLNQKKAKYYRMYFIDIEVEGKEGKLEQIYYLVYSTDWQKLS